MYNNDQETTYRTLLLERQGGRFSEPEVTEILRQVLPPLAQIHSQGQAHGAISLDSLVQRESRAVLVNIAPPLLAQFNISQDIYALGIAMIELLTAKAPHELRDFNGKWNWEDYCLVSDQLGDVLNRMVTEQPQNRFASANEVLSALNLSAPRSVRWGIQDTHPKTTPGSLPQNLSRSHPWLWVLGGVGAIGLLAASTLPSFFKQGKTVRQAEAKWYVQVLNKAQIEFYKQNGRFTASPEELGTGLPIGQKSNQKNYEYEVYLLDPTKAIATATAQRNGLKSFTGIAFVGSTLIKSEVCMTDESSRKPPRIPEITGDFVQCPPGTQSLNRQDSGIPYSSNSPNLSTQNSSPQSSQTQTYNPFERVSFPQPSCGDSLPTDPNAYPVSFYPVFVEYSESNLQIIKLQFCSDAYEMTRKDTGNQAIQVGSFASRERADLFKDFLLNKVGNAEVGEPKRVERPASSISLQIAPSQNSVQTERVSFSAGGTGATVQGSVSSNQIKRYLLNCRQGQQFIVSILQGDVNVAIISPNGQTIGRLINDETNWQGLLPSTGDYAIRVSSPNQSNYAVKIEVF